MLPFPPFPPGSFILNIILVSAENDVLLSQLG